jgi:hypothetical protein
MIRSNVFITTSFASASNLLKTEVFESASSITFRALLTASHLEKQQLPETSTMAIKNVAMCRMLP